jgi:predicted amidohydrolase YtcJ
VVSRVKAWAKEVGPGTWIQGRGWDQNLWPTKQFPTHDALSRAFPNNPVVLTRIDGHAILANAKAMEAALRHEHDARTTGAARRGRTVRVFVDNANSLVYRVIPARLAPIPGRLFLPRSPGPTGWMTGIHDRAPAPVGIYEELAASYNLRNYVMLSDPGGQAPRLCRESVHQRGPQAQLTSGFERSKLYADGALGSRGAAACPVRRRFLNSGPAPRRSTSSDRSWAHTGFQINVHAIGDRGNRIASTPSIPLSEKPKADHRFRIETPRSTAEDIPRFARLGVIPR